MKNTLVILENIRSANNVGSIFRIADATAVSKIILLGYTPKPIDRMGRVNEKITKTSLGAENSVKWESEKTIDDVLKKYKNNTFIAVEQTKDSKNYKDVSFKNPAYIFGNEVDGISEDILEKVSHKIEIPMLGKKESLNVSISAGIILYNNL